MGAGGCCLALWRAWNPGFPPGHHWHCWGGLLSPSGNGIPWSPLMLPGVGGWTRCFLWGWLQWAVIVSECFVLLGYPGPGPLARGSWLLLRVVYISWRFWVASFSSTYSEIYEAKRKPRTQSCVFLWAPRSLPSLSALHLSESYVLFCFVLNVICF